MKSLSYILLLFCCKLYTIYCVEFKANVESDDNPIWDVPMFWDNDVYTGRHLDELVSSFVEDTRIVNRHTILILYDDDSYDDVVSFDLTTNGIPGAKYLNFFKYNVRTTPRHIWYPLVGVDNLVDRYLNGDTEILTPRVFFFKAGNKMDEKVEFPLEQFDLDNNPEEFKLWVWDQVSMQLLLTNKLPVPVHVRIYHKGEMKEPIVINGDGNLLLDTHVSSLVTVTSVPDQLVHAFAVEQGMEDNSITIDQQQSQQFKGRTETQWLTETNEKIYNDNDVTRNYAEYLGQTYLRQFKQPALVGKYTQLGHTIQQIPQRLFDSFIAFYDRSQDTREPGCTLADGTRNGGDIECTTIPIPLDTKIELAEYLRPHLEDWCGQNLEMTHVYGINEYWDNTQHMNTLGKVTEHVISAELVLKKDLREQPDWELEILNNQGQIEYTHIGTGMMLLYESSSVPIKRPRPFAGRSYINVVVHYRPRIGWPWKLAAEDIVLSDGHAWENLRLFNTKGTLKEEHKQANSPPVHSEL